MSDPARRDPDDDLAADDDPDGVGQVGRSSGTWRGRSPASQRLQGAASGRFPGGGAAAPPLVDSASGEPTGNQELRRYWLALRRNPWVPILLALLATGGTALRQLRVPPIYRAQGMVQIGMNTGLSLEPGEYYLFAAGREQYARTQETLLTSERVAALALERLGESVPPGQAGKDKLSAFLAGVRVVPVEQTYLVRVEARGGDPEDLARRVNALMDAFIPFTNEFMVSRFQTVEQQLERQIPTISEKLREKQEELRRLYASSGNVQFDERRKSLLDRQRELGVRLTGLQLERAAAEAERDMLADYLSDPADEETLELLLASVHSEGLRAQLQPLAELRARLVKLRATRLPDHPDLLAVQDELAVQSQAMRGVGQRTLAFLERKTQARAAEEVRVQALLDGVRAEIAQLDLLDGQYNAIKNEVDWYSKELEATRERHRRAESRVQTDWGGTQIISRADPPTAPEPTYLGTTLLLVLVLSFGAGLGLLILHDLVRDTVSDEEEARLLGLPILGLVPTLDLRRRDGELVILRHPSSRASEAFRAIRTQLAFSTAGDEHSVIIVTSAGPRDGKTFVAVNVAAGLALGRGRTLLVDADMRRPRVQQALGISHDRGLSDVLTGQATLDEVIQRTELGTFDVLPSGPRPPSPADLLTSDRFLRFVEEARGRYQHVVIDSPPVALVTDASLMAQHAEGVLFVLRLNQSHRRPILRGIEQIEAVGGKCLGLVLNGVSRLDAAYGYGYGGYGYGHGYYHDEGAAPPPPLEPAEPRG